MTVRDRLSHCHGCSVGVRCSYGRRPHAMECVMRRLACAAALTASLIFCVNASAETYPSRPITLIVPFGAGGPTDVIARVLGQRMGKSLGQTIVVENVTGAAGTI